MKPPRKASDRLCAATGETNGISLDELEKLAKLKRPKFRLLSLALSARAAADRMK